MNKYGDPEFKHSRNVSANHIDNTGSMGEAKAIAKERPISTSIPKETKDYDYSNKKAYHHHKHPQTYTEEECTDCLLAHRRNEPFFIDYIPNSEDNGIVKTVHILCQKHLDQLCRKLSENQLRKKVQEQYQERKENRDLSFMNYGIAPDCQSSNEELHISCNQYFYNPKENTVTICTCTCGHKNVKVDPKKSIHENAIAIYRAKKRKPTKITARRRTGK